MKNVPRILGASSHGNVVAVAAKDAVDDLTYCRCAEAPAAISRNALTNPAAVFGSASASN